MFIGEIELYKAVLLRAAKDAYICKNRLNKDSALHFFRGGDDLSMFCDFAHVDYDGILLIVRNPEFTPNQKFRQIKELIR